MHHYRSTAAVEWMVLLDSVGSVSFRTPFCSGGAPNGLPCSILLMSSELLCCATSHSLAVMSMRLQMSISTVMAFSWILVSKSDTSYTRMHENVNKTFPTWSVMRWFSRNWNRKTDRTCSTKTYHNTLKQYFNNFHCAGCTLARLQREWI